MSLSQADDKENLRQVTTITIPAQNKSRRSDFIQCATPHWQAASRKKASWKLADDETLLECLRQQQAAGHQSDTGFKPVAWTACALALKGSEKLSGGSPKTVKGCKDHFGTVSANMI
jgi:hypothetical protein